MNKKSYHHNDLRNALIKKGIELVSSDGLKSFSLRKLAAACEVSHAAPYSHFENLENLIDAMQNQITNEFAVVLEKTILEYRDKPNILEQLGVAYVEFFIDNPHYFSFLFTQSNLKIDLSLSISDEENYRPFVIFKNLALEYMNQYGYPKEKQNDTIIAMWSFVHGIASITTMGNVHYEENWNEKISDLINILSSPFIDVARGNYYNKDDI